VPQLTGKILQVLPMSVLHTLFAVSKLPLVLLTPPIVLQLLLDPPLPILSVLPVLLEHGVSILVTVPIVLPLLTL
jgi:hypothetical protein